MATVPVVKSLADIYPEDALRQQSARWDALYATFRDAYGDAPSFVARSPGRVNIIGEHIDYSLYSVLPMAITADAIIAVSVRPLSSPTTATCRIRIGNVNEIKFPRREFSFAADDGDIEIDATASEWTNYFKSGLNGALALLRQKAAAAGTRFCPCDMDIIMDGTVPVGGGLSSSAAFVSASALAVMAANGQDAVDKKELTELAIISERSVGVYSGGMDQAASVLSELGSALFVSFSPRLDARPIEFPRTSPDLGFVIAQSFVTSTKHDTAPTRYNLRVVECSLAAGYLNVALNPPGTTLPLDAGPLRASLKGFHDVYAAQNLADLDAEEQLRRLIALTERTLTQEEGYTREELAQTLRTSVVEDLKKMAAEEGASAAAAGIRDGDDLANLERRYMSKFTVRADRFKLRQRALHVFSEALRVVQFLKLLNAGPPGGADTSDFNQQLGNLMNATQDSCRDLYECSCPEIDQICRIARGAGAYGSRLTGAGWGGCTVHLVPVDKIDAVKAALDKEYYATRNLGEEERAQAVVVSRPARGSATLEGHSGSFAAQLSK